MMGIEKLFKTTHHLQDRIQAEHYNRTLLESLRDPITDHLKDWDRYKDMFSLTCSSQVHKMLNSWPFALVS